MDSRLQKLLEEIKAHNQEEERLKSSDSEGDRLLYRLRYGQPKTKEEWFGLHNAVHDFLSSDNPDVQKQNLRQYTEMLAMIISGYKS